MLFRSDEEGLAIEFYSCGDTKALADHLVTLLGSRDRQVEMALQNISAALRMSMPEIIREYLRTFELRQQLGSMRSLTSLRKLPYWFPFRGAMVRRGMRKALRFSGAGSVDANASKSAEVVYMDRALEVEVAKTGTEGE